MLLNIKLLLTKRTFRIMSTICLIVLLLNKGFKIYTHCVYGVDDLLYTIIVSVLVCAEVLLLLVFATRINDWGNDTFYLATLVCSVIKCIVTTFRSINDVSILAFVLLSIPYILTIIYVLCKKQWVLRIGMMAFGTTGAISVIAFFINAYSYLHYYGHDPIRLVVELSSFFIASAVSILTFLIHIGILFRKYKFRATPTFVMEANKVLDRLDLQIKNDEITIMVYGEKKRIIAESYYKK